MTKHIPLYQQATAYHEAGHAMAGLLKGFRIRKATVTDEANSVGHVHFGICKPRSLRGVHAWGIVSLAGEAAQRQFNPRTIRKYHGGGDRDQARSIASSFYGSGAQIEAVTTLWAIQAKELVHNYWPAVTRVANALMLHRTMTEKEIRETARQP